MTTNKLHTQTIRRTKHASEKRPAGSTYIGRSLSKAATAYRDEIIGIVRDGGAPKPPPGLLALRVDEYPPDHRRHDIDGPIKLLTDSIAAALGFDDYRITLLTVRRHPPCRGNPRLEVTLATDAETNLGAA